MPREFKVEDVLSMGRAYQVSCVLAAAAELDLFTAMKGEALRAEQIAERLLANRRGVTVLLDALAAVGLLDKSSGTYVAPPAVAECLAAGGAKSVLAMARHQANCMRKWTQLAKVVKSGTPADRVPSIRGEEADAEAFIEAMNDISGPMANPLIEEIGITDFRCLLDVGGASGTWTMAWLDANPDARAILFDLPHVVPMAEWRLLERGYSDRVEVVAGDFSVDELPTGADLVWLGAIVHQHSRKENRALFGRIFKALEPGGRILIRDIVMEDSRTRPPGGAFFAVNMLVATKGGGTFTLSELREDLEYEGFQNVERLREDEWMNSIVAARRPA